MTPSLWGRRASTLSNSPSCAPSRTWKNCRVQQRKRCPSCLRQVWASPRALLRCLRILPTLAAGGSFYSTATARTLPASILESAFDVLDTCDLVVGPTHDGGYYLVGAKASHPDLFTSDGMGTANALEALLTRARALGAFCIHLTDPFYDTSMLSGRSQPKISRMNCSACQGEHRERLDGAFRRGQALGANGRISMRGPIFPGYIQGLKTLWPRGICHVRARPCPSSRVGWSIFRWVQRQQDLDARMPEFIGLLLLAGILYVIGVFWVERFRL